MINTKINKYILYKHTSPSGKYYIGITKKTIEIRAGKSGSRYLKLTKSGKFTHAAFAPAIIKYGWDNFSHEVLFSDLSESEANKLERKYIKEAKSLGLSYNVADGGKGADALTPEIRRKISDSLKGHKLSEESKKKISIKTTGRKLSDETKQKMKASAAKHHSKDHIMKVAKACEKAVLCFTKDGKFFKRFESVTKAAVELLSKKRAKTDISACLKGRQKSAGGYLWYLDTPENRKKFNITV